ncbi:MAG: cation:proton antiporter, partial [Clostridia bacterium]|nr:cation:proton antiporter [Clostridia bacterium]
MHFAETIASLSMEAQALLAIAILWLAGFLMSRVSKVFSLPNVTGYILAGVVIGPYCLNLIPADITQHMSFITDAALALIAFGVGRYMRLDVLKADGKKVMLLTLLEAMTAAVLVTVLMLTVFHLPLSFALLLGAIGSATAPASSLMTIRQYHAKGPFVNTLIQVVALDDAVALLAFSVSAAIAASAEGTGTGWQQMVIPLLQNLGVLLVSYLLGRLLCVALKGRSPDHRIVLTCAFIFAIAGGCAMLNISPLLGCMMLGATYTNVTDDKTLFKQINRISPPINILFFVLSGMRLNISALSTVGIIGVSYFAIRIVGKYIGSYLGCRLIKSPPEVQKYLGLALIPQAGVSIGLAVLAQRILPAESGMLINTIILSSSVLYEMIGPMSAKYALVKSGAIRQDALGDPVPAVRTSSGKKTMNMEAARTVSGKPEALPQPVAQSEEKGKAGKKEEKEKKSKHKAKDSKGKKENKHSKTEKEKEK